MELLGGIANKVHWWVDEMPRLDPVVLKSGYVLRANNSSVVRDHVPEKSQIAEPGFTSCRERFDPEGMFVGLVDALDAQVRYRVAIRARRRLDWCG
jgi:hypothetical protein